VAGATHRLVQRLAGHGAGAVDDEGKAVGLADLHLPGHGIGRVHPQQHRQALGGAGDQRRLERGEDDFDVLAGFGHAFLLFRLRRHCRRVKTG